MLAPGISYSNLTRVNYSGVIWNLGRANWVSKYPSTFTPDVLMCLYVKYLIKVTNYTQAFIG